MARRSARALSRGNVDEVGRLLFNRLAEPAARLDARIADYYKRLAALAPAGQLLSGSGSSLFALCRSPSEAERITADLRTELPTIFFECSRCGAVCSGLAERKWFGPQEVGPGHPRLCHRQKGEQLW